LNVPPEVRVQTDTKIIISLSESEAGKLARLLDDHINFGLEGWADNLFHDIIAHVPAVDYAGFEE
jgi:hypothetical protein